MIARQLGEYYLTAPCQSADRQVQDAWQVLANVIDHQYFRLTKSVRVVATSNRFPYPNSLAMRQDITQGKRLLVSNHAIDHPLWTDVENWRFRAVHDYYGHWYADTDYESIRGEVLAYVSHLEMTPLRVHNALTCETMGQLMALAFMDTGTLQEHRFPPQKCLILPRQFQLTASEVQSLMDTTMRHKYA